MCEDVIHHITSVACFRQKKVFFLFREYVSYSREQVEFNKVNVGG